MTRDMDVTCEKRRTRRAGWFIAGLVSVGVATYFGCYLYCGESHQDDSDDVNHPATVREYRTLRSLLIFVPAAWLEANLTGRTVLVAEKHVGPFTTRTPEMTMTARDMVLYRWIVDPGAGFGHGFPTANN